LNDAQIKATFNVAHNPFTLALNVNTPFKRIEQLYINGRFSGSLTRFSSENSITYNKNTIITASATVDLNNKKDVVIKISCPCKYIGDIVIDLKQNGNIQNFNANAILRRNGKSIKTNVVYHSSNHIVSEASLKIETPFTKDIFAEVNFKPNPNFRAELLVSYGSTKIVSIESSGKLSFNSQRLDNAKIVMVTVIETALTSKLTMKINHQHNLPTLSTTFEVEYDNDNVLSLSVKLGEGSGMVVMSSPYKCSLSVSKQQGLNGNIKINWDTTSDDSFVELIALHSDKSDYYGRNKDITVKVITSARTVSYTSSMQKDSNTYKRKSSFSWDEENKKSLSYSIDMHTEGGAYGLTAELNTPVRSIKVTGQHSKNGAAYTTNAVLFWDADREPEKKMSFYNEYRLDSGKHQNTLTLNHPALYKDMTFNTNLKVNTGSDLVLFNVECDCGESPFTMNMHIEDMSNRNEKHYAVFGRVSHPASTINTEFRASLTFGAPTASADMSLNYMTSERKMVTYSTKGSFDKNTNTLNIKIDSPSKKVQSTIAVMPTKDGYSISSDLSTNEQTLKSDALIGKKSVDMKVFYTPENVFYMKTSIVSVNDMHVDIYRVHNGRKIQDASIEIEFENNHLLKTKMYARPAMKNEIKNALNENFNLLKKYVSKASIQSLSGLKSEMEQKMEIILANTPAMTPFLTFVNTESSSFNKDFATVSAAYMDMYRNDEFYMRSIFGAITHGVSQSLQFARDNMIRTFSQFEMFMEDMQTQVIIQRDYACRYLQQYGDEVMFSMQQKMNSCVVMASPYMNAARNITTEYVKIITPVIKRSISSFNGFYQAFKTNTKSIIMSWMEEVLVASKPLIETAYEASMTAYETSKSILIEVIDFSEALITKIPTQYIYKKWSIISGYIQKIDFFQPLMDVHISIRDNVKTLVNSMNTRVVKVMRQSSNKLSSSIAAVHESFLMFLEHDETKYAHEFIQEVYRQAKAAYSYLDVERNLMKLAKETSTALIRIVRKNAFYMIDEYLNLEEDRIVNYNPRRGILEFQVWIPVDLPTMQMVAMPNLEVVKEMYLKLKEFVSNLIPEDFSIYDYYYQYYPSGDLSSLLPPFKAFAMISGYEHLLTFDGQILNFAGSCSYTLARDFADKTFEVQVNNENNQREITVLTENKKVTMLENGYVMLDDEIVSLPFTFGSVSVSGDNNTVVLTSTKGFSVECNAEQKLCTLSISGWYYNKVAGLFGTYTNEKYDDLLMSTGVKTADVSKFGRSWAAGSCSFNKNNARTFSSPSAMCERLFSDNSSDFRKCYKVVKPAPFGSLCSLNEETARSMYTEACAMNGVQL